MSFRIFAIMTIAALVACGTPSTTTLPTAALSPVPPSLVVAAVGTSATPTAHPPTATLQTLRSTVQATLQPSGFTPAPTNQLAGRVAVHDSRGACEIDIPSGFTEANGIYRYASTELSFTLAAHPLEDKPFDTVAATLLRQSASTATTVIGSKNNGGRARLDYLRDDSSGKSTLVTEFLTFGPVGLACAVLVEQPQMRVTLTETRIIEAAILSLRPVPGFVLQGPAWLTDNTGTCRIFLPERYTRRIPGLWHDDAGSVVSLTPIVFNDATTIDTWIVSTAPKYLESVLGPSPQQMQVTSTPGSHRAEFTGVAQRLYGLAFGAEPRAVVAAVPFDVHQACLLIIIYDPAETKALGPLIDAMIASLASKTP